MLKKKTKPQKNELAAQRNTKALKIRKGAAGEDMEDQFNQEDQK